MKAAIIGCGAIAGAHLDAIRDSEVVSLVGAVDTDRAARDRAGSDWDVPAYASVGDLLDDQIVDIACVCTPPVSHRAVTEEFLNAGVHVLCEKPIAITTADARAMFSLARKKGLLLAVSAKFRFVDDLALARRVLEEGLVGRPLSCSVSFCAPVAMGGRWNVRPEVSGGGVVMDNAPHALDVLSHVLQLPLRRLTACLTRADASSPVEDSAEILFEAQDGESGRIGLSWIYFGKDLDYLVVHGTEGTLRVGWTGGLHRRHGEREWTAFGSGYDKRTAFSRQLAAVYAAVSSDDGTETTDSHMSGHAIQALEFVEAVYRSRENMKWEPLGEATSTT